MNSPRTGSGWKLELLDRIGMPFAPKDNQELLQPPPQEAGAVQPGMRGKKLILSPTVATSGTASSSGTGIAMNRIAQSESATR
jgi:hypothetical protein